MSQVKVHPEDHARSSGSVSSGQLEAWRQLAAELAKPHFMTSTSGGGKHTIEFSFHGDEGRERRNALHDALIAAIVAANS